jgi:hypothetical protein
MSQNTPIQWTDDTVNPVMGCNAPCELRPTPKQVRESARQFFLKELPKVKPSQIKILVEDQTRDRNATEIYQLRERIVTAMLSALNESATGGAVKSMTTRFKARLDPIYICYAHQQHMFRGSDITNPDKRTNPGFAPQFEKLTRFPGRMALAARRPDLFGKHRPNKPWLHHLPRVFFISDMADALSAGIEFDYLREEIVEVVVSDYGRRHIWLWLTKKPERMAAIHR